MSKKHKNNYYRKIYEKHHGKISKGYHIHHKDGNPLNNDINNLEAMPPEEHNKLHEGDFVLWASKGGKKGNEALRRRIKEKGYTAKELALYDVLRERVKKGLHRTPHSEQSKKVISDKKKELLKDKTRHPMWGNSTYKVTSPDGKIFIVSGGWKQWCKDRGLNNSNLRSRGHSMGWKAELYNDIESHKV